MPTRIRLNSMESLAVGGVLFLGLCTAIYARGWLSAPQITCESASVNLGVITSEEPLDCLFSIRNTGHAELHISQVKTGCACTVVPFYQERLQPGESTMLPIRVDVKGRHGSLQQTIMLITNDPAHRHFPLRLTADIQFADAAAAGRGP